MTTLCRVAAALTVLCAGQTAFAAACEGRDLRAELSATERAALAARVAATPFNRGISWTATRGPRQLHLIGTVHVNDPRLAPMVTELSDLIARADAMLVESTPQDLAQLKQELAQNPSLIFIQDGPTLIDRMPAKEWEEIAQLASAGGIAPFMAAKMRPWFLAMMLSLPKCARETMQTKQGFDVRLMEKAEAKEIPIRSLEPPLAVFEALNAAPLPQQVAELRRNLPQLSANPDHYYTMIESYFDGEIQSYLMMVSTADAPQSDTQKDTAQDTGPQGIWDPAMSMLLKDRNLAWLPIIEATEGNTVVIAVGAAHLPGEEGLLNLLASQGYEITEAPL